MTKQWEQYEATIRALYADHTLATVRQIMIERHGFNASVRAYRGRLDRWNVRKYNRRNRNGSVSSGSGSGDDGSSTQALSGDGNERVPAPMHNDIQGGWNRNDTAAAHHHHYQDGASISAAATQPPPYSPSEYIQRRHPQKHNEDKTQPAPLLSSPLQPAGYSNPYYWANSQDPHQSSLGGQVSAASATAAATTTITNPVVTSSPPFYGNFVPVTQPLSSWPSDSSSVFAANHPETDGTYGFGHHHDQRLGGTGHLEMPFSADMHNSPSSSGSGAQDARYHGAAGDDAQGYEATPQDLPGRGGSH